MEIELQKLVDGGKLTDNDAEALQQLAPGSYCSHKSWGFGRIKDWNPLLNQIIIDFEEKADHSMQLAYAAGNLTPIPADHILARRASEPDVLRQMAQDDPLQLVRVVLESLGGQATQAQITDILCPKVLSAAEFKKWWEATRKKLKKDGHFLFPAKRTLPIELRDTHLSRADELVEAFEKTVILKDQVTALEALAKETGEFYKPAAQLGALILAVEDSARKNRRLNLPHILELLSLRDDILDKLPKAGQPAEDLTLATILAEEQHRLVEVLSNTSAARLRRILSVLPQALGDQWTEAAFRMLREGYLRVVTEAARLLRDQERTDDLRALLERSIREASASPDLLLWFCREQPEPLKDLLGPEALNAILAALERDQLSENRRGGRLYDMLVGDPELMHTMLEGAEIGTVRDLMRRLMLSSVFEELDRRSVLARLVKLYPTLQSMVTGQEAEKAEALTVSWSSLEQRKKEFEELVNKKIPENSKEIQVARSYGDLRENFEYKAAKEMQAVLLRRKSELEELLNRARGSDFSNPDTTVVSLGTRVRLRDLETGGEETYTILGAWDGDPENRIISYLTEMGQALIGKSPGEEVELPTESGVVRKVQLLSIEAAEPTMAG